jgi:hypothetical protein
MQIVLPTGRDHGKIHCPSGCGAAWQRACFGSRRPRVRISPPPPMIKTEPFSVALDPAGCPVGFLRICEREGTDFGMSDVAKTRTGLLHRHPHFCLFFSIRRQAMTEQRIARCPGISTRPVSYECDSTLCVSVPFPTAEATATIIFPPNTLDYSSRFSIY